MFAEAPESPSAAEIPRGSAIAPYSVTPMFREGQPFGTILAAAEGRASVLANGKIALLKTFGDQAAIAIENVRLFNETKEALDQQRASGEVLAAISSSIADRAPVFEKILESCERLFAGRRRNQSRRRRRLIRIDAYHGPAARSSSGSSRSA